MEEMSWVRADEVSGDIPHFYTVPDKNKKKYLSTRVWARRGVCIIIIYSGSIKLTIFLQKGDSAEVLVECDNHPMIADLTWEPLTTTKGLNPKAVEFYKIAKAFEIDVEEEDKKGTERHQGSLKKWEHTQEDAEEGPDTTLTIDGSKVGNEAEALAGILAYAQADGEEEEEEATSDFEQSGDAKERAEYFREEE